MVARSRGGGGVAYSEDIFDESSLDTSLSNKHLNNQSFVQAGRASMGGAPPSGTYFALISLYRRSTITVEETSGALYFR